MRSIIFYLMIVLFSNCGSQSPKKFKNQKQIEIQYEALSRGFFENILISEAHYKNKLIGGEWLVDIN